MNKDSVVNIKNLKVDLASINGIVHAVRDINLDIKKGEVHGIVGESGCGKSMTVKTIMRLHDEKRTRYHGEIIYNHKNILEMKKRELNAIRGRDISMIFQDPMVGLDPIYSAGEQVGEMIREKKHMKKAEAKAQVLKLFEDVGIYPAEKRYAQYPFEMSGGMLQRVMIALALSLEPQLLIADEPTTALDVTIQLQILELLKSLQKKNGMAIILVTHNLGVIAEICDRVSVMYAGKILETSSVYDIFDNPCHPYTNALMDSSPKAGQKGKRLITIPGTPPKLFGRLEGC
ncbi:MAG TPA: ABC transporter ATP-binding protein, partial [Lachnospiraceae bacterium]|nr:ABC transporter ATP-binding protein [Lachnospiraceae bacterium]